MTFNKNKVKRDPLGEARVVIAADGSAMSSIDMPITILESSQTVLPHGELVFVVFMAVANGSTPRIQPFLLSKKGRQRYDMAAMAQDGFLAFPGFIKSGGMYQWEAVVKIVGGAHFANRSLGLPPSALKEIVESRIDPAKDDAALDLWHVLESKPIGDLVSGVNYFFPSTTIIFTDRLGTRVCA